VIFGHINGKSNQSRIETILHTVPKFQSNHSCFQRGEVSSNFDVNSNLVSNVSNADTTATEMINFDGMPTVSSSRQWVVCRRIFTVLHNRQHNEAIVAAVYLTAFTFCRMDFTFSDRNGLSPPWVRSISGQTVEIPYISKNFRFDLWVIHNCCITQLFNITSC